MSSPTRRWSLLAAPLVVAACANSEAVVGGRFDAAVDRATPPADTGLDAAKDASPDSAPDVAPDVAPDAAPADAPPEAAACAANETRCGDRCVDTATDRQNCGMCGRACEAGQTCAMGACACAPGATMCGAACVDTANDPNHCGMCGRACPSGRSCMAGTCMCPSALPRCGDACVDIQTDDAHCGACGTACPMGERCAMGRCACAGGLTRCAGACVDTDTSDAHCGACGRVCPTGQRCVMGGCACPAGQTRCGDACVDTASSDAHCGACGRMCPTGQRCVMGACACPEAQTRCGDVCVDTRVDRANCGACGTACAPGQFCSGGTCRIDCAAPRVPCGAGGAMVCVDPATDATHCGRCGNACMTPAGASGAACRGGACAAVCAAGRGDCDMSFANGCEVDTNVTTAHCGRCGNACPATAPDATAIACAAGACVATCRAGRGDCDGMIRNGCETDVTATPAHCGRCGNACGAGEACVAGRCLPRSCATARAADPMAASGVYRIDPDGPGGLTDFEVYCDMTTAGGGWTLLATVYNTLPTDTRRWNTDSVFQADSSFGDLAARATDDFKSPAYARVPGADLLVLTEQYHFGFRAMLGGASFGSFVRARVAPTCSTTWIRSGVDFASTNLPMNAQRALGFAIRGLDVNGGGPTGGCAVEGSNENSFLNFLAGPSWWVFGVGNCVRCAGGWTSYDNGMLNLASIATGTCTANSWPCNANGLWWQSGLYPSNPDTKTRYVQLLVR